MEKSRLLGAAFPLLLKTQFPTVTANLAFRRRVRRAPFAQLMMMLVMHWSVVST